MKKFVILLFVALFGTMSLFADLKIDSVFSSNMVLQQQKPIKFFGKATANSTVKVEFASKTLSTQADKNGVWSIAFPAMKAGKKNYVVKISDGKKTISLNDVLIGEVWFCSGQSNMAMPISKKIVHGWSAKNCVEEVKNAKYPEIRYACQSRKISHNQLQPAKCSWVKCDPKVAHDFSATAYFFARQLYKDLDTPIGIINSSWSGTRIEPWISEEGYINAKLDNDIKIINKFKMNAEQEKAFIEKERKRYAEQMTVWHKIFAKAGEAAKKAASGWASSDFDDSSWKAFKINRSGFYRVCWYRSSFELPEKMKNKTVTLNLNKAGEVAQVYLNGKQIASFDYKDLQKSMYLKLKIAPNDFNQNGKNVLAIRAEHYWYWPSNTQTAQVRYSNLTAPGAKLMLFEKGKMNEEYSCNAKKLGGKAVPGFINLIYKSQQFQCNLYNGMIDGWTKIPVRGVIWYQGCSNAGQFRYHSLLRAWIADWRAKWNNPELPFFIVQLAGFAPVNAKNWKTANPSVNYSYAVTRDIQLQMISDPNVGIATAVDIGEATNIHPSNKQDVGRRLAMEAERMVYGKKIVSRGPLFKSAAPENGSIRVKFDNAKGLKTADGKAPNAFAIAGVDKKFVWADAKIDGEDVIVSSNKVKEPKYVRYAFVGYRGDLNLQNGANLPTFPFRTDVVDYSKAK